MSDFDSKKATFFRWIIMLSSLNFTGSFRCLILTQNEPLLESGIFGSTFFGWNIMASRLILGGVMSLYSRIYFGKKSHF